MQITDVRVRKITKEGKMRAIVSITIDEEFVIHDIKVIEGDKGLFIAMPSKKATDGEYRDIAHPINSSTREKIQSIILEGYQKALLEADEEVSVGEVIGRWPLLLYRKFLRISCIIKRPSGQDAHAR